MKYCTRCLYPENHPLNIVFDDEGVCSGCRIHEEKDDLNWRERRERLAKILEEYRDKTGESYDCIIPVNGGKDSYYIVHVATKEFGLNPLLVTYNHEYNTKIGIRNLANLLTVFDCDHITYTLDTSLIKKIVWYTMKRFASMYWHVLAGTLTFPVQVAVKFKIPLIIWGVNGWLDQVGMFSHLDEVEMTKKARKEHALMGIDAEDMIDINADISRRDIQPFIYPFDNELETVGVKGVYLGNYIRWDSKKQHEMMIDLYGYETAPQQRTFNTYEDVDCFHSAGVHDYIKYLKYGYGKATDHAVREIRLKRMTREEGIEQVRRFGHRKPDDLGIFLNWIGMTEEEFNQCIDTWRDPRIWSKDATGEWVLQDSIENHINDPGVGEVRLEKIEDCHFTLTPSREPDVAEDEHVLMGRGYIDKYNYRAVDDNQEEIEK
jgi:N-acetyl sugar amidotransferase